MATINAWLNVSYCVALGALFLKMGGSPKVISLSVAVLMVHFSHQKLPCPGKQPKYFDYALLLTEFVLLTVLSYGSQGESTGTIFLIYTANAILNYPASIALPWVYTGYSIYLFVLDPKALGLNEYVLSLINFSFGTLSLLGVRLLIHQRKYILDLNQQLQSQAQLATEMTRLKERNDLAEAMHDTLGHTLTASIVSLEGVTLLWEKRPTEAIALLNSVRGQLQTGLGDIRRTVRNLKTNTLAEHAVLRDSLIQMVERVNRQTSIDIELQYKIEETLLPIQDYVLYSIVQESITNALKHGQASSLLIALEQIDKSYITLMIADDGDGADAFVPGFGLTHLSQKVEALGGTFSINTQICSGFSIQAWLPLALDRLIKPSTKPPAKPLAKPPAQPLAKPLSKA